MCIRDRLWLCSGPCGGVCCLGHFKKYLWWWWWWWKHVEYVCILSGRNKKAQPLFKISTERRLSPTVADSIYTVPRRWNSHKTNSCRMLSISRKSLNENNNGNKENIAYSSLAVIVDRRRQVRAPNRCSREHRKKLWQRWKISIVILSVQIKEQYLQLIRFWDI